MTLSLCADIRRNLRNNTYYLTHFTAVSYVKFIAKPALNLFIAEAIYGVVIDHAGGLHVGINNCGPKEFEAARFKVKA